MPYGGREAEIHPGPFVCTEMTPNTQFARTSQNKMFPIQTIDFFAGEVFFA